MSNKIQTINIFLNSKNRDVDFFNYVSAGTPNFLAYCGWNLRQMIKKTSQNSYFTIAMKTIILPFSFNNISTSNRNFVFEWGLTGYSIDVNIGNPNILQLLDDIKAKILALAPALTNLITLVYNSAGNTVTITNLSGLTFQFLFLNNFIGRMLGFQSNLVISPSTSASSAININVNPCENIFVRCDNLAFTSSYESLVSKNNISDIIGIIPIQVASGNYINYSGNSFETRLNDNSIDYIQLYLTSIEDDDHILDLKLDWTIHLEINEYKSDTSTLSEQIDLRPIEQPIMTQQPQPQQPQPQQPQETPQENTLVNEELLLKQREEQLEKQLRGLLLKKKINRQE